MNLMKDDWTSEQLSISLKEKNSQFLKFFKSTQGFRKPTYFLNMPI